MSEEQKLQYFHNRIYDNSIQLKYLLENAIYKKDTERETFILVELGLRLTKEIINISEKISLMNHY